MLNLTDIANRISYPVTISNTDTDSLKQLCETYPYAQIFPILYLKSLANSNDVRLDQELENYAFRISDRRTLYYLIQDKEASKVELEESYDSKTVEFESSIDEEFNNVTIDSLNKEPMDSINGLDDSKIEVNELNPTNLNQLDAEQLEDSKIDDLSLDDTIENVQSDESLTTEINSISAYSIELEEKRLEEEKQRLIEALKADPRLNDQVEESSFIQSVDIDSKRSFSSWLQANQSYENIELTKPTPDELINKFIETAPKISSPKDKLFEDRTERTDFFSPTKKAKESLDEGQLPVSETLAKIFAAQGNFPKAIYAYEQLMLIIPEKKIFFANQISELQKKINLK